MGKGRLVPDARGLITFHVSSGFGGNTKQPFVEVEVGDQSTQMSPEAARALALNLLQCAEAAETDAAIMVFAQELDLNERATIGLLRHFRTVRDRRHGASPETA